jgi:hypothetical protein
MAESDNDDECAGCFEGGSLVCCDHCPRSWHVACTGDTEATVLAADKYRCPACRGAAITTKRAAGGQAKPRLSLKRPVTSSQSTASAPVSATAESASETELLSSPLKSPPTLPPPTLPPPAKRVRRSLPPSTAAPTQATSPLCALCHMHGELRQCAACRRLLHLFCVGAELDAGPGPEAVWMCPGCVPAPASSQTTPSTAPSERRIMAGQSLSNTISRKPASANPNSGGTNNSGGSSRVQGPRSALTSFLEESKIVAPRQARSAAPASPRVSLAEDKDTDDDSAAASAARQQARVAAVQQALADVGDATGQVSRRGIT